ncbi:hypothetical protein M3J09_000108 [Ascochyta lentis]
MAVATNSKSSTCLPCHGLWALAKVRRAIVMMQCTRVKRLCKDSAYGLRLDSTRLSATAVCMVAEPTVSCGDILDKRSSGGGLEADHR